MSRLKRLLALPPRDRGLLLFAVTVVVPIRLGLWLLPLRHVLAGVNRLSPAHRPPTDVAPERLAWAVAAVSRAVPRASCLTQALAARLLLARHGLESEIRFGVARDEHGTFVAHAWLLHEGRIILGDRPDLSRYAVLPPLALAESRLLR